METILKQVKDTVIDILDTYYTPYYNISETKVNGKNKISVSTKNTLTALLEYSENPCTWYIETCIYDGKNAATFKRVLIAGYYNSPVDMAFQVLKNILAIEIDIKYKNMKDGNEAN